MNRKVTPRFVCLWGVLAVTGMTASRSFAVESKDSNSYYQVDAAVVSLDANLSLASYRSGGKGTGSPGAQLGYSTPEVEISIALLLESNRFYADVKTRPNNKKSNDGPKTQRIDLTSLRPTSVDLGTDKDGRVYHLNLMPSAVSVRLKPKSFQEAADELYRLQFHESRIMLNDKTYVGRMLASDAQVFRVEVCGVASLEFSLRHLKGAEPWGRLQDGQITLSHPDGTSVEIGNVTNGAFGHLVEGGPYTVWVRWKKPQQTVDEYRVALSQYRDQLKNGATKTESTDTTAKALAQIEYELARESGPWVTNCGACDLPKKEFVGDE
jgi:hypothetical protein